MAKAYSSDIRKRIIELLEQGLEQNDVAQRLMVSQGTVSRTWIQYQRTGSYDALPHSGGRTNKKLFDEHVDAIIAWLEEQPDLFNREIAQMIQETYGIQIDPSLVSIVLRNRGYTRKKNR